MRASNLLVISAGALLVWACASTEFPDASGAPEAKPASVEANGNDCAIMAAVAREHYKFGLDSPAPPLKGLGEPGWRPQCDWAKYGLSFSDYNDVPPTAEPRQRLNWVAFQQPQYDGNGATIRTEIMHGPLAGIGYECRLHSGIAGWTVAECKTSWVS